MFSTSSSWLFTVVFALTGLYALVRLAELTSTADRSGSRVVELSHLLMSIAMIAMSWAFGGGPATAGGVVQIVVFGLFTVLFAARLVPPTSGHSRTHEAYHVVMNATMVFMVAAMPQIMGMDLGATGGSGSHHGDDGGMDGMPGMAGMGGTGGVDAGATSAPWAVAVSWVFIVLLLASAVLWAVHVARPSIDDPDDPDEPAVVATSGGTRVDTRVPARAAGLRLDAGCHLLMSLGMAGMLLAML